jgi:hypothetical protein
LWSDPEGGRRPNPGHWSQGLSASHPNGNCSPWRKRSFADCEPLIGGIATPFGGPLLSSVRTDRMWRHLRRVLPTRLYVPPAPLDVLPLALPRRGLTAVSGLELAGLDHPEASARLRAEGVDQVAGLGHRGHGVRVDRGNVHTPHCGKWLGAVQPRWRTTRLGRRHAPLVPGGSQWRRYRPGGGGV